MTDKEKNNDDYELPPGIVLPEDEPSNYPDWKKGIIAGVFCGIFFGFILAASPLSKDVGGKIGYGILGFAMGVLMAGGIVAFRPSKK